MSKSGDPSRAASLIGAIEDEQALSPQTLDIMKAGDMGAMIQAGLGVPAAMHRTSRPVIVANLIDDTPSIEWIPEDKVEIADPDNPGSTRVVHMDGPGIVCYGQGLYIDAFTGSKQKDSILMSTWLMNEDEPVHPYVHPDNAVKLVVGQNYRNKGCTPLYRKTCGMLSIIGAKLEGDYAMAGTSASAWLLIVTDGRDEDYDAEGNPDLTVRTPEDCAQMITDLGERLIVQAMGIGNPRAGMTEAKFRDVFHRMGVQDQHILLPGASMHEIRDAFQLSSQSALSASQGGASFSKVAQTGVTGSQGVGGGFAAGGSDPRD